MWTRPDLLRCNNAVLPVDEHTVLFLSGLLRTERQRLGTRGF
jgi:hypothetical protein